MKKYMLVYQGGGMPKSDEEAKQVLGEWKKWQDKLGDKLVDMGFPFMPTGAKMTDGMDSTLGLSGYSVVQADSFDEAMGYAKDCPVKMDGSMVHVYEEMELPGMGM